MNLGRTRFETELQVRPDDLDFNQHVHASRYYDYVLAARYDQMARCYMMSLEQFFELGFAWFTRVSHMDYKRPLRLGEHIIVRTWIDEMRSNGVLVLFEIVKKENGKLSCSGYCDFTLVDSKTGRATVIPESIREKYSV
jgi:YbgC/YbaW family acyl-CoA thioester hydrolase